MWLRDQLDLSMHAHGQLYNPGCGSHGWLIRLASAVNVAQP